jgi:molecular chaperone Hsp33
MSDQLLRGLFRAAGIRAIFCDTTTLSRTVTQRLQCAPIASVALGRALSAVALLGAGLKGDATRVGVQCSGDGVLRSVYADADRQGNLRGYVSRPRAFYNDPPERLPVALGKGTLTLLFDRGTGSFYRGVTELTTSTIDGDLAHHLNSSEQLPSLLSLAVSLDKENAISASAGVLLQVLPGTDGASLERFRSALSTQALEQRLAMGFPGVDYLAELLAEVDPQLEILSLPQELRGFCPCTKERAGRAFLTLGAISLAEIIQQDQRSDVTCEFCGQTYEFDLSDLLAIKAELQPGDA